MVGGDGAGFAMNNEEGLVDLVDSFLDLVEALGEA